ncbi:B12-binding domain-containing radical SAM protein [Corallococcus carmarthensis]|uniref:B12-binding domain-containing radical SAM protein n=1 Tax=Corallococcus carmarthensis TaxID=2316728 RepID=UPI00148B90B0|nr:radical SAM protein [Corallococcus carmarthensis]NOK18525.1 radical SAM protein [Corallococcus carmarthensis]
MALTPRPAVNGVAGTRRRTPIYLVNCFNDFRPPLALGLIAANLRQNHPHLLEAFDLSPGYIGSRGGLFAQQQRHGPGLVLFSDYVWNLDDHLELSRELKTLDPANLTIHGGPSVPRHPQACEEFLRQHRYVDIACQGEGEATVPELLERMLDGGDTGAVPGVAQLVGDTFVQARPRPRSEKLDLYPSPYLTGEFDDLVSSHAPVITLETNRGCPYGCTFCDWGQATLQKIHCFSMERVTAELTWAARNRIAVVGLADANFGILPRDLEIARLVASLKQQWGYPLQFQMNNAKNATSRVSEIVRIAREAGLVSQGVLSIQTRDEEVLSAVKRKNIKPAQYDALLAEFRADNLPVHTEIMMALPGSTYDTFARDLQWACDKNLTAHVAWTGVLPNTPMAEPEYIARYRIRMAGQSRLAQPAVLQTLGIRPFPPNLVVSSTTFTEDEFLEMAKLSAVFHLFQGESILKHVMLYLRHEHGLTHVAFLEALRDADLAAFPLLRRLRDWKVSRDGATDPLAEFVLGNGWPAFYDEVEQYIAWRHGIRAEGALCTVYQVQRFVMAWSGRPVPATLEVAHDFGQYVRRVHEGDTACRLSELGPATLTVYDPGGQCAATRGPLLYEPHCGALELSSSLVPSRVGPLAPRPGDAAPSLRASP